MEFIKKMKEEERRKENDKRVKLNIGGHIFETWLSTLERIPGTRLALLATLKEADESWDSENKEFFFDRHPGAFVSILHYYRTEELHTDQHICGNIIKGELEFWGLTELDIEPCCWGQYSKFKDHKETLAALDDNFTSQFDTDTVAWEESKPSNLSRFKRQMWVFLEEPGSSRGAKCYAVVSMFFVVLSIATFCLETYDKFRVPINEFVKPINKTGLYLKESTAGDYCVKSHDILKYDFSDTKPHLVMQILDYICAAYFTTEYSIRIFFAPKKFHFIRQPLNVIDIFCLIPHLIAIILVTINPNDSTSQLFKSMLALRTVRILRVFKLMKHYSAFNILVYTIKVSIKELMLMIIFLLTGVLIFASVIFYVESENFENIPIGIWWALVTMTTVGYGDKVPKSEAGYVIGCFCVICGVLTVAFTVPIVVNNFALYYAHAQSRIKLPVHERKELKRKLFAKSKKSIEMFKKWKNRKEKTISSFTEMNAIKSPRSPPLGEESPQEKDSTSSFTSRFHYQDRKRMASGRSDESRTSQVVTISDGVNNMISPPHSITPTEADINEIELHKLETANLLHNLQQNDERMREERKRQLGMLNEKRELKRMQVAGKTPRTTPAPAASSRPSKA